MKLELIEGCIPQDAPDGKYLARFSSKNECAVVKTGVKIAWAGGKPVHYECDIEAHCLLEPAEPKPSLPAYPLLARWIGKSGEPIVAARLSVDGHGWVTSTGARYTELGIPIDAEHIDPNSQAATIETLRVNVQKLLNKNGILGIEIERLRSLEAHHAIDLAQCRANMVKQTEKVVQLQAEIDKRDAQRKSFDEQCDKLEDLLKRHTRKEST